MKTEAISDFRLEVSDAAARGVRERSFGKDEILFSAGDPVECIFRVVTGSIRLVVYPDGGKQLVLFRATAGEIFCEDHLDSDRYQYTAIAMEDSVVQSIERTLLLRELRERPTEFLPLFLCASRRSQQLRSNFQRIAVPEARTRVLDFLRELKSLENGHAETIDLRGKLKGYADDLNLSHEAMYRAIRKLEDEGSLIRVGNGCIRLK